MSRNLLHKSKLEPFKAWLSAQGIQHRPPRGDYQVLMVNAKGAEWWAIYDCHTAPEHYTVDIRMEPLARRFIRETRAI